MRLAAIASLALATACATVPPFHPVDPSQAVPRDPEAGTAPIDGVRITVRPGSWEGAPSDLNDRLTPVEVYIENASGRALQIRPRQFTLLAPNGFHYAALDPQAVRHALASYPSYGAWTVGFYGGFGWPGFYGPWGYPYGPWGWGVWGPSVYYVPSPDYRPPPRAVATQGTLETGGHVSFLLFFPVPANSLGSVIFEARLEDATGAPFGEARIPFVRKGYAPPQPPPAQAPGAPQAPQPTSGAEQRPVAPPGA